jgi:hypothetical protein
MLRWPAPWSCLSLLTGSAVAAAARYLDSGRACAIGLASPLFEEAALGAIRVKEWAAVSKGIYT